MKKPARKRSEKRSGASTDADLEALLGVEDLKRVREMFAAQAGRQAASVEGLLERALAEAKSSQPGAHGDRLLTDLADALNETRLEANGGDAQARRTLARAGAAIDEAAARDAIHPGYLIVFGRAFAKAGLDIGEAARAAMRRAMAAGAVAPGEAAYGLFLRPLFATTEDGEFELYDEADHLMAIFPSAFKAALVEGLARDERPIARRTALGFLLNRDETVALAAIAALGAAKPEADARRRLEIIRPWLSPPRQDAIEKAFGPSATRKNAPPTQDAAYFASVCDGSGASALFATIRRGKLYAIASLMTKPSGVAEALIYDNLGRAEKTAIEKAVRSATPTAPVRPATFLQLLRLALGRNLESGAPPPFALVESFEALGLGPVEPDRTVAAEILSALLAGTPGQDDRKAVAGAHERIADSEFGDNWYEAGDAVDAALRGADSPRAGAEALLETYLPARRGFWANVCALSALALRDNAKAGDETWRNLALVGRDVAGGAPLADIPLVRRIAATSAESAFAQR
jgi:hypothetical protein